MDNTTPNFFSDSLPYGGSNTYHEDDQDISYEPPHHVQPDITPDITPDIPHDVVHEVNPDIGMNGAGIQSYTMFDPKFSTDQSPTISGDGPILEGRPDMWPAFPEPSAIETTSTFVDPGLYGSRDRDIDELEVVDPADSMDANTSSVSDVMSQISTRRSSSNKSNSHRSSKSDSMSTDITPPEQDPPKKKKQRSKKGPIIDEDEHKRNKFLERNRLAASKCREKKKLYTQELEGTKISLEARNVSLQREYSNLVTEVSDLKHQLMVHAKCNDRNIDAWLEIEARRFVQTSDAFGQPFAGLGQPGQTSGLSEVPVSPKSRHASIASNFPTVPGVQLGVLRPGAEGPGGSGSGGGGLAYSSDVFPPSGGAGGSYSTINPPGMKRERDINFDHMTDDMFTDQSTFGGA